MHAHLAAVATRIKSDVHRRLSALACYGFLKSRIVGQRIPNWYVWKRCDIPHLKGLLKRLPTTFTHIRTTAHLRRIVGLRMHCLKAQRELLLTGQTRITSHDRVLSSSRSRTLTLTQAGLGDRVSRVAKGYSFFYGDKAGGSSHLIPSAFTVLKPQL